MLPLSDCETIKNHYGEDHEIMSFDSMLNRSLWKNFSKCRSQY